MSWACDRKVAAQHSVGNTSSLLLTYVPSNRGLTGGVPPQLAKVSESSSKRDNLVVSFHNFLCGYLDRAVVPFYLVFVEVSHLAGAGPEATTGNDE